jgi:hypothetical protein
VRSAIEGGRLPQFELDRLANTVEKSGPDYFAIQQGADAPQIGRAIVGVERFGKTPDDG